MRLLWVVVYWFAFCLTVGAAFAGEMPLPAIHLVRVNDPIGLQGFDLKCTAVDDKGEPECTVTEVKSSRTVQTQPFSFERARKIAAAFLGQMPKEKIYDAAKGKTPNPPIADVLLVWNVQLGGRGTDGVLKRNTPEKEYDGVLKRAVLTLEMELAKNED